MADAPVRFYGPTNNLVEVSATNPLPVSTGGGVASGATDSGNPVKVGGVYNSTAPTFVTGQRGDLQISAKGSLITLPTAQFGSANNPLQMIGNTGDANSGALPLAVASMMFNGVGYDRVRANEEATLLASAARTTTQTSADIINYRGLSALVVVLDMTSAGSGSVTVTIDGKDTASGKYYNLLTGAAIVTNNTNRYQVSPRLAAVTNVIAQDHLPRVFRIVVTANNANTMTYSVGYNLLRD